MAVALIVAAGRGERLGSGRPKALVELAGRPLLWWSVDALRRTEGVERIIVAMPPDTLSEAPLGVLAISGGSTRSHSVREALAASKFGDPVIVHDAARPLATPDLFQRALDELEASAAYDALVAAAPVSDTIKEVGADGRTVVRTLRRTGLWAVQTPQVFRREILARALQAPDETLAEATDDAWLVERAGGTVGILAAGPDNLKITRPADLRLAEALLADRTALRAGSESA